MLKANLKFQDQSSLDSNDCHETTIGTGMLDVHSYRWREVLRGLSIDPAGKCREEAAPLQEAIPPPTLGFWAEARDCPELISGSHWPLSFVTSRSWWELMIGHADFIVWGGSGDPGKISRNPPALALVSSWSLWTLSWPHHARGKRLTWVTVKGKGGLSRHWDNVPSRGPLGLWPKETANKLMRLLGSQLPLPSQQSPASAWN